MPESNCTTLTYEQAHELLSYDPLTGVFRWKKPGYPRRPDLVAGTLAQNGYMVIKVNQRRLAAHRLAWLLSYQEWPAGEVDHIDGDRANNCLSNLREVTRAGNCENQRRARADSTTGVLGAFWEPRRGRFFSRIGVSHKTVFLGYYNTAEDAHQAYLQAKRRLHSGCTL